MRCKKIERILVDAISEGKESFLPEEIQEHLAVCKRCRDVMNEIQTLLAATRKISIPPLPADFWESARKEISERAKIPHVRGKVIAALIGATVIAIFTLFFHFHTARPVYEKPSSIFTYEYSLLPSEELIWNLVDFIKEENPDILLNFLLKR